MADLDSLSIQISADAANAVRSINNLAKALDSLNTSLGKLDIDKLSSLSHVLNDVANAAERLSSGSSAIKDFAKAFKDFEKASAGAKKARKATEDLANSSGSFEGAGTALRAMTEPMYQMSVVGNALATVFGRLIQYVSGLNEYASVSRVFAQLGGSSQRLIEDMGIIDTTFREIPEPALLATESVDGFAEAVDKAAGESGAENEAGIKKVSKNIEEVITPAQKAKMAVKSLEEGIRTFGSTVKSAGSHFVVFAKRTMATATGLNGFKKFAESAKGSVKKLAKEITRIAKMLKLMVTRMVLRQIISGIGDGFKNLAQYSKQFDASISLLWNDFRQLGNSVAAAASPLVNVFAPAIHAIIQLVIQAVNAINQLLSAITGLTSFVRAKKLTDSYAASLDKSNKSAKALKKTVLGFDELNQLQDNKNNGGGGTSPLDMFEDAPIEKKWADWANKIKNMWKTGDFTELGASIGKWLLNALESIPWNKVKAKAYKIGKSLATLLNGIIETPKLGREIGKTIAEVINTGVLLANGFVRNFHWDSLGKFIGETFNGFFENIDWYYIKDTVVAGMRGLASAIQNFIDTFNWDNISNFVINALDTLSAGIKAFFENIDWKDLGKKFGQQIKKILNKTNWKQIGEAIGDILQAAIDFAAKTLDQLSWSDLINAITDLFKGIFEKADWKEIDRIIGFLLETAFLAGVGKMVLTAAKSYLTKRLTIWIAQAIGDQAVASAASTALGGTITGAAGSSTVAGAGAAAGASLGSVILGGVLEFLSVHAITNEVMKSVLPEDAELYGQYSGLFGFFTELKDVAVGVYDLIDMKVEDLTKDHVTMTEEQKRKLDELRAKAEETATAYGKIYDTKAAEGLKNLKEHTDALKESNDGLLIIVEHDQEAIENAHYSWSDFMDDLSYGNFHSLDEIAEGFNRVEGAADKDIEALERLAEESKKIKFKPLSDEIEESTTKASNAIHIFDTKAEESFKKMSKGSEDLGITIETVSYEMPEAMAGAQESLSGTVQTWSKDVGDSMTEIQASVDESMRGVNESLDTVKSGMTEDKWTFSGVWEGLTKTFEKAKEGIKGVWDSIANKLNGEFEIGSTKFKINLPKFYANGGFPSQGSMFIAGERGAELVGNINGRTAVANNDQITNGIAQAVFNAMTSAQSSGGGQYINNTIMVDGMVLARAVTKGQNDMNRRYSPTMA